MPTTLLPHHFRKAATFLAITAGFGSGGTPRAAVKLEGPRYLAFASDRAGGAGDWDTYLYDRHEGVLVPLPGLNGPTREIHPALTANAEAIFFTSNRPADKPASVLMYDRKSAALVELPGVNVGATSALPSATAGGRRVTFTRIVYNTASADKRNPSHVLVFDRERGQFTTPEKLNAPDSQHKLSALSGDGRILAFVSTQFPMMHQESIRLFDLRAGKDLGPVTFPDTIAGGDVGLPSLSHTGRFLAFGGNLKDRPSDPDLFVYDREKKELLDTPGLNSPQKDEFSSISADGRYLAFESLRSGNWDLFLYDLQRKSMVELPGLNTPAKERHPAISRE